MLRTLLIATTLVGLAGCPRGAPERPEAPAGERVQLPGVAIALYAYPETIAAYVEADRGAYVVRIADGVDGARAALEAQAGDDVLGDDGLVLRLTSAERAAVAARPGVVEVRPLQPAERRAARAPEPSTLRIDLFADASADETAAVAAWIASVGGSVTWRGATALVAALPPAQIAAAARLSPVRWVE